MFISLQYVCLNFAFIEYRAIFTKFLLIFAKFNQEMTIHLQGYSTICVIKIKIWYIFYVLLHCFVDFFIMSIVLGLVSISFFILQHIVWEGYYLRAYSLWLYDDSELFSLTKTFRSRNIFKLMYYALFFCLQILF